MPRESEARRRSALARRDRVRRACELGAAADAAPVMIWVTDAEGRIEQVNRRWAEFIGYAPEPGGDGAASSVHPDDLAEWRDGWARAVRERTPLSRQFRVRRKDGAWRWLLDAAEPRWDAHGRFLGHAGAAVDITEQREAMDALRVSEARFRSFAEASDDLFWMADASVGKLTFANSALERVWGGSRAGLLGQNERYWSQLIHPDDLPRVAAGVAQLQKGEPRTLHYRVRRPRDGEERIVEDRAFPVRDEAGVVRLVGGIFRDVTEQVRAREELERRVAERTAELEASNAERLRAEAALAQAQRLETVGRLTGGVAHDFNNLLTVMIGGLDMIRRRPDQTDRVLRLSEAALEAGRRGERLTRQLLSFSRRHPLKLENVAVGELIRAFEPMLRGAVGEATPLSMEIEDGLGARLDKTQFESALLNLVVNARDALGPDGTIRVIAHRVRLPEGALAEVAAGDYVRVAVIDTGEGMPAEVAASAFEPFFTTKRTGAGSGLGLAQVYGFARQSGGGAEIASAPGQGTTVSLYLPAIAPPGPTEAPPAQVTSEPSAPGLRVLLVDDDAGVRAIAEGMLLDLGFEVVTAADGPSALAILDRDPQVGLLLSDVVMPGGMSGVDLARAAHARRPDLAVLLSTGYASDALAPSVAEWPVLRKPYRLVDLEQATRRVLAA